MNDVPPPIFPHIRLAVSECLIGQPVRYDGQHKRHPWVCDTLATRYTLIPICPEVAAGLGVPRPPIQLYGNPSSPNAREVAHTDRDHTDALNRAIHALMPQLEPACGLILKARSPSCGIEGIPVHPPQQSNIPPPTAAGLFTATARHHFPLTPMIDEEALTHPARQASFLTAIHLYHQWRIAPPATPCALTRFHQNHTVQALAHQPVPLRQVEMLLNQTTRPSHPHTANHYIQQVLNGLLHAPRRGG